MLLNRTLFTFVFFLCLQFKDVFIIHFYTFCSVLRFVFVSDAKSVHKFQIVADDVRLVAVSCNYFRFLVATAS